MSAFVVVPLQFRHSVACTYIKENVRASNLGHGSMITVDINKYKTEIRISYHFAPKSFGAMIASEKFSKNIFHANQMIKYENWIWLIMVLCMERYTDWAPHAGCGRRQQWKHIIARHFSIPFSLFFFFLFQTHEIREKNVFYFTDML